MSMLRNLVINVTSLFDFLPEVHGTPYEKIVQRMVYRGGWEVGKVDSGRVYFTHIEKGLPYSVCVTELPNCLARISILGRFDVPLNEVDHMEQYLQKMSEKLHYYHCSLVSSGGRYTHTISLTGTLESIANGSMTELVPEMARIVGGGDELLEEFERIRFRIEATFGKMAD